MPCHCEISEGPPIIRRQIVKLFEIVFTPNTMLAMAVPVEPILSDGSTLSILAGIALGPSDVAPEVIAIDRCHTLPVCVVCSSFSCCRRW